MRKLLFIFSSGGFSESLRSTLARRYLLALQTARFLEGTRFSTQPTTRLQVPSLKIDWTRSAFLLCPASKLLGLNGRRKFCPSFCRPLTSPPAKKNPTDTAGPWSTPPPPGPSRGSQPIAAVLSAPPNVISLLILQPTYSSTSHSTFSIPSSPLSILSSSSFSSHTYFHPFLLHIHSSCLLPPTSSRSLTFLWPPLAARRLSSLRMRCPVSCRPEPSMLPTSLSPVPALLAAFT